ncbi:MAG TPA: DUF4340 domain-containing protein [Gemmataceae bacterium]|nr:DUF4340 domain-containing protein [Gemmataceae bacterium]
MNLRTTLLLLLLTAGGAAAFVFQNDIASRFGTNTSTTANSETTGVLNALSPDTLTRVDITHDGQQVVLERQGKGWTLPGGWPARVPEVRDLVNVLTGLHSRFVPVKLGDDLKPYGLDESQKPVRVTIATQGGGSYALAFGEPPAGAESNPFVRPTYVRLGSNSEVLTLAPGLLTVLKRPRDAYQKRQLFAEVERVRMADARPSFPGDNEPPPPVVNLLDARKVTLTGPDGTVTLTRADRRDKPGGSPAPSRPIDTTPERVATHWMLTAPVADRIDPERLKNLLAAVPELWVEQFVSSPEPFATSPDAAKTGLDKPERAVAVEFDDRPPVTVQIGKVSRVVERKPPAPPQTNPFQPPPPPPPAVREEYRYAKLPDNPQVFEVRADKFGDLFVPVATLRDAKLFRFRPADAQRLEIVQAGGKIVLTKQKDESSQIDRWKLVEPIQADAEQTKVTELLDKLADLQGTGPDVIDNADAKTYNLAAEDGPRLTVTVTEEIPAAEGEKKKETRTLTLRIGKPEPDKNKVYVKAADIARIDAVGDDFLKLFDRPVLAYRGRRVLDVPAAKVASIAVQRAGEGFTLTQADGSWKLTAPVTTPADAGKAGTLAADLGRLEAVEYVNDAPKPEDLTKYGLDKPAISATVTFNDPAQPAKTIQLGQAREGKPEAYAKLTDAPGVFAVRQAVKEAVDQSSLAFRPLQLWSAGPATVKEIDVERPTGKYKLSRADSGWKLSGPFEANASPTFVQPLVDALATPRAERYEAHKADDVTKYGFDKPELTLTVAVTGDDKSKTLVVGRPTAADVKSRFAKLADSDAVFVVPEPLVQAADKPALDLLDRRLITLDPQQVTKLQGSGTGEWALQKEGDAWRVASLTPPATADKVVTEAALRPWANLNAQKFVAYGPQVDLAKYGLDKPAATVTVTLSPAPDKPPVTHTLALGKSVEVGDGTYARLDNGPGIAIVSPAVARELTHTGLDFVDRTLITFDWRSLTALRRKKGDQELEVAKQDDGWQVLKPAALRADQTGLDELAEQLSTLRAARIAAVDATDLKPFGLDMPAATVTLAIKDKDGKPADKVVQIGQPTGKDTEERFAKVEGTNTVAVLPADIAKKLVGDPLKFRDRSIARFADADRAFLERGFRKAIFAKVDGTWKMTEPLAAEAEATELDDLIGSMARLRADELVAEKADDLKPYGLDAPEVRWRFLSGDREVLQILVGKRDDATGRRYAKLAGGDLVFLLAPDLSVKVTAEYRKRTVWTNFDSAQAESLIYAVGGNTLVLSKSDQTWQIQGQPGHAVNATVVNEILATLAAAKVERFIVDKGADFQLYGLQPPERTIIARTRMGAPQTLYLGRFEGDSKRVYARVLDSARTDVFVLSEADSAKLARDLAAFTGK